jgi:hypothetical protein
MLLGHWGARKSLQDLGFSVKRQVRKCYHLGMIMGLAAVKRSTLADANQQGPRSSSKRLIAQVTYYSVQ